MNIDGKSRELDVSVSLTCYINIKRRHPISCASGGFRTDRTEFENFHPDSNSFVNFRTLTSFGRLRTISKL